MTLIAVSGLLSVNVKVPRQYPVPPSRRTRCPLCNRWVASATSITAGMPYSRATIAPWDSRPPTSAINPPARASKVPNPHRYRAPLRSCHQCQWEPLETGSPLECRLRFDLGWLQCRTLIGLSPLGSPNNQGVAGHSHRLKPELAIAPDLLQSEPFEPRSPPASLYCQPRLPQFPDEFHQTLEKTNRREIAEYLLSASAFSNATKLQRSSASRRL